MALVQAGGRSIGLIEDEIHAHGASKVMVQILADIGGPHARAVLRRLGAVENEVGDLARRLADRMEE